MGGKFTQTCVRFASDAPQSIKLHEAGSRTELEGASSLPSRDLERFPEASFDLLRGSWRPPPQLRLATASRQQQLALQAPELGLGETVECRRDRCKPSVRSAQTLGNFADRETALG